MAIRLDASTDALSRTTTLPTITTFTMMGWFRIVTVRSGQSAFLALGATSTNVRYTAATDTNGTTSLLWNGTTFTTGAAFSAGTWEHFALIVSGTGTNQCVWYRNGATFLQVNGNSSVAAQKMWVGNDEGSEWLNGRAAAIKVYSAVLTLQEVQAEMRCYVPLRTLNLNTWSPLMASTDVGNYQTTGAWTVGGTLTTEEGPPIPWSVRPVRPLLRLPVVVNPPRPLTVVSQAINRSTYL